MHQHVGSSLSSWKTCMAIIKTMLELASDHSLYKRLNSLSNEALCLCDSSYFETTASQNLSATAASGKLVQILNGRAGKFHLQDPGDALDLGFILDLLFDAGQGLHNEFNSLLTESICLLLIGIKFMKL